jgi:hypothetical protein
MPPANHTQGRGQGPPQVRSERRVGAGFAGFNAARELSRRIGATAEVVVINSNDYFLYTVVPGTT